MGSNAINIASWNVLAAPWASPQHYPHDLDVALLERAGRNDRLAARLRDLGDRRDIWCFQEVTEPELTMLCSALNDREVSGDAVGVAPVGTSDNSADSAPECIERK